MKLWSWMNIKVIENGAIPLSLAVTMIIQSLKEIHSWISQQTKMVNCSSWEQDFHDTNLDTIVRKRMKKNDKNKTNSNNNNKTQTHAYHHLKGTRRKQYFKIWVRGFTCYIFWEWNSV